MKIINEEPKQKGSIKTMKVKGRKSKLTPELIEKISTEILNGKKRIKKVLLNVSEAVSLCQTVSSLRTETPG